MEENNKTEGKYERQHDFMKQSKLRELWLFLNNNLDVDQSNWKNQICPKEG